MYKSHPRPFVGVFQSIFSQFSAIMSTVGHNLQKKWQRLQERVWDTPAKGSSWFGSVLLRRLPNSRTFSSRCEGPRPHAWSMCAACLCPCISLARATPLGRSRYQTSEFPTELPTSTRCNQGSPAQPVSGHSGSTIWRTQAFLAALTCEGLGCRGGGSSSQSEQMPPPRAFIRNPEPQP